MRTIVIVIAGRLIAGNSPLPGGPLPCGARRTAAALSGPNRPSSAASAALDPFVNSADR